MRTKISSRQSRASRQELRLIQFSRELLRMNFFGWSFDYYQINHQKGWLSLETSVWVSGKILRYRVFFVTVAPLKSMENLGQVNLR